MEQVTGGLILLIAVVTFILKVRSLSLQSIITDSLLSFPATGIGPLPNAQPLPFCGVDSRFLPYLRRRR